MYFAQNNTRTQFELYLTFLAEVVDNNSEAYKTFFQNIISEVRGLCIGQLTYSNLSREHFDIIAILANNHPEFFREIDVNNITLENYQQLLNFLSADVDQLAYQ